MQEKLTVLARFRAKSGMEEDLKKLLLALIGPSRSDEGCINYDLHQAIDDPALFILYENWQSREHLDKHSATPHVEHFRSAGKALLGEPPELTLMNMIS
jgi:quinol monooxygenase YgiN